MLLGLAPMDGFTDCAFRQITKEIFEQYGEKEKYELVLWTEFMNADGYIINPLGVVKHLLTDKDQTPVIAQIFGANEDMLVQCFADIEKKYEKAFSGIELNMGCPARNVMNTGGGSALLKDRNNTLAIIKKLRNTISLPLSFKTRTGIDEQDTTEQMKFLVEASNYVDMITIHGRTVKQGYAGNADWDFIYKLRDKVRGESSKFQSPPPDSQVPRFSSQNKECKIIGNGGIKTYEDIDRFKGNLDGVMIGQAAIGNPRIFTPHIPTREEIKTTILKHLDYMISYENFFQEQKAKYKDMLAMPDTIKMNIKNIQAITLAEFRKHLFQYVKGIPGSKEFKQKVSTIVDYEQLVEEIQKFFE
ncbi:MAG TPA: tRNA-dihydrouridine synthase [Candidatus Absconditabacterales bacterium]|nr:tRNA-dihydrouridine synthase [Candidatus Absconditabacterales bacterium]